MHVDAIIEPLEISGPWDMHFDPRWGGPEQIVFDTLLRLDAASRRRASVTTPATATYRKTFTLPADYADQPLWIDLGKVCDLAVVRLNGQPLGTLWMAPWRVEITVRLRPGDNVLEVDVINAWHNRLVG